MIKFRKEINQMEGWLLDEAITLFDVLNTIQTKNEIIGNIMEIGTYKGKSACVLGQFLNKGEKFYGCDTFSGYKKVENTFRDVFEQHFKNVTGNDPVVLQCESLHLREKLDKNLVFRIWHIDGFHSFEDTLFDLNMGADYTSDRGLIIADDFLNADWLGVSQAINYFLDHDKGLEYCLVAQGYNKTVLCKKAHYEFYYNAIKNSGLQYSPHNFLPFHGVNYLSLR